MVKIVVFDASNCFYTKTVQEILTAIFRSKLSVVNLQILWLQDYVVKTSVSDI